MIQYYKERMAQKKARTIKNKYLPDELIEKKFTIQLKKPPTVLSTQNNFITFFLASRNQLGGSWNPWKIVRNSIPGAAKNRANEGQHQEDPHQLPLDEATTRRWMVHPSVRDLIQNLGLIFRAETNFIEITNKTEK